MATSVFFGLMLSGWINLALALICFGLAYRIRAVLSGPIALIGVGALINVLVCVFGNYVWLGTAASALSVVVAMLWIMKIFT